MQLLLLLLPLVVCVFAAELVQQLREGDVQRGARLLHGWVPLLRLQAGAAGNTLALLAGADDAALSSTGGGQRAGGGG